MRRTVLRTASTWFLILTIGIILAACKSSPTVQSTATPQIPIDATTTIPSVTATSSPSPTSAPEQRKLILIGSADQAGDIPFASIHSFFQEQAGQENLVFENVPSLGPGELSDDMAVVIALPPDPGVASLAASGDDTQFLAVGIPGLQPADNLSVIDGDAVAEDQWGFVAGYLAAVISKEWRVGMIGISDSPQSQLARQGFTNGVTYYCGLCRSPYPPFYIYPIMADLTSTASSTEAQAAADTIISQAVNTVFVYPGAGDQAMLDKLAEAGVAIIGAFQPPPGLSKNWVATIEVDPMPAIRELWPELLDGQGNLERSLAISLVDRNEQLFSPGRQHLVDELLADLKAGFIDTGVTQPSP